MAHGVPLMKDARMGHRVSGTRAPAARRGDDRLPESEEGPVADQSGKSEDGAGRTSASSKSTGAGAEAAEGIHATDGRSPHDKSAVTNRGTGREGSGESERTASEPMDRTKEHKGSYGGEGGSPRTSSDQRESNGKGGNS